MSLLFADSTPGPMPSFTHTIKPSLIPPKIIHFHAHDSLPFTGSELVGWVIVAVALIALGWFFIRRHTW